jgi:hypothetical protein
MRPILLYNETHDTFTQISLSEIVGRSGLFDANGQVRRSR